MHHSDFAPIEFAAGLIPSCAPTSQGGLGSCPAQSSNPDGEPTLRDEYILGHLWMRTPRRVQLKRYKIVVCLIHQFPLPTPPCAILMKLHSDAAFF